MAAILPFTFISFPIILPLVGDQMTYFLYSSWLFSLLDTRWMYVLPPRVLSWSLLLLIGFCLKSVSAQLLNCLLNFVRCLAFCSPQLGKICLWVHGLNKKITIVSICVHRCVYKCIFLVFAVQAMWGYFFAEVISCGHDVQYICLYMFLMESVSPSGDVVWCCVTG